MVMVQYGTCRAVWSDGQIALDGLKHRLVNRLARYPAAGHPIALTHGVTTVLGKGIDTMVGRFQLALQEASPQAVPPDLVRSDWRAGLPVLTGRSLTLRELRLSDAPSLHANLSTPDVERFIPPPPSTVEGFERFIQWVQHLRRMGRYAGFGMVPHGEAHAVGILQVRQMDPVFYAGEWGFALGSAYWGTGLFMEAARLVLDFSFDTLGVHRLEARAAIHNGRGLGALVKLGAVREATLRRSLRCHGQYLDQSLWSILKEDWLQAKAVWGAKIH